jgi:hypothetical protein
VQDHSDACSLFLSDLKNQKLVPGAEVNLVWTRLLLSRRLTAILEVSEIALVLRAGCPERQFVVLRPSHLWRWGFLFPALAFTLGCGNSQPLVKGTVTYEGKKVEDGWIRFCPVDGKGPTTGGKITAGSYEVTGMVPGKQQVMLSAHTPLEASSTSGPIRIPRPLFPADAVGNNRIVEISKGTQIIDFHLKKGEPGKQEAVQSGR